MADLNYTADIDTRGAQRSLDALKNQILGFGSAIAGAFAFKEIQSISSRFEDLRTTLQLLYKSPTVGSNVFDDIKKFAETSIFSVEALTETIVKLKAGGIEPTISQLRLFADVSSVAADSVGALQAITDLYARTTAGGLGLEDLNRLADRGIPVFTILSERLGLSRLQISEIGKTAEGARIILRALEDGLTDTFGGASAARANNVSQALSNFGDSIANASDQMGKAGLNEGLTALIKAASDLVKAMTPLLELVGAGLGGAFKFLAENIKPALYGATAFFAVLTVGRIIAIVKAFNLLNLVVGKSPIALLGRLALLAGIGIGTLQDGVAELEKEFGKTNEAADELAKSEGFKELKEGKLGAGTEDLKSKVKALNEALNKFKVEMDSIVNQFARYNAQLVKSINLETSLIGQSKEIAELRRAEADITQRASEEIARLIEEKAKLTKEERDQGRGGIIDQTIAKIKQQAENDKAATAEAIANSEARQRSRQVELFSIQNQIDKSNQLVALQDQMAKLTMNEIQQKYYDIDAAARASAKSAIEAEEARIGRPLNVAERQRYYDESIKGTKELKAAQEELYVQSQKFDTGWAKALNEFTDNAMNAADKAYRVFQKMTSGMEDLIVDFAKTGKWEWRNFVNSIVEELLRSQIRTLMAQVFNLNRGVNTGGGGGGLLGGAIIPGFLAKGGPATANKPYIVGEKGPELFVPGTSGTVIPNNALVGNTSVTYNINAVDAMSFKQMIAADPSFIYAVTQQGAKSVPSTRR